MKNRISKIKYDYKKYIINKTKFMFLSILTLLIGWGITGTALFTFLSGLPLFAHVVILMLLLLAGFAAVSDIYSHYVNEGKYIEKKETMKIYLEEVILNDEFLAKLYADTSDYRKNELVRILFENEVIRSCRDKT